MNDPGPEHQLAIEQAGAAKLGRRYRRAAEILETARKSGDTPLLRRALAYTLGGGVEYRLQLAQALQIIIPDDILERLLVELDHAARLEETIPDLHWDIAVLHARFTGDLAAAQAALDRALDLGMQHPMIPAIQGLLARKSEPETPGDSAAYRVRDHFFRLVDVTADATIPELGPLNDTGPPQSFADYVMRVEMEVRGAGPDPGAEIDWLAASWRAMREAGLVTADSLDYGTELVFRAAAAGTDDVVKRSALADLAVLLRDLSFHASGGNPSASDLRKARRIAQRGLDIVAGADVEIDADLYGDLWLALAQGSARPADLRLAQALDAYTHGLQFKRAAGNNVDVARLTALLQKMLNHAIQQSVGAGLGFAALGQARTGAEAAYAASKVIDDHSMTLRTGIEYVHLLSALAQPILAIDILDELLEVHEASEEERFDIQFEKAMRLSEARRQSEALALHERLKDLVERRSKRERCIFWNSYSNVLRELQMFGAAFDAIQNAFAARPEVGDGEFDQIGCMLHSNRGIILLALDRLDEAEKDAELAAQIATLLPVGDASIRVGELRIQLALRKGDYATASAECDKATARLNDRITKGGSDATVWQSMLQEWSRFDGMGLEAKIKSGERPEACLALAEAMKGRLLWLLSDRGDADAKDRLTLHALAPAVQRARDWVAAGSGKRCLVALFCSTRGIAIFSITGPNAIVVVHWIDGPVYDRLRDRSLEVWGQVTDWALDQGVQGALAGIGAPPELVLNSAEALSHLLLEQLGALMYRAIPSLADGGTALVLIPHRALRSLPLAHARLPDGRHLSEIFGEVTVAATMELFATMLDAPVSDGGSRDLFLDPEDNLPFARLEGAIAAPAQVRTGWQATKREFLRALQIPGTIFVSAHSAFVPTNPWKSWIAFHDGRLSLYEMVQQRGIRRSLLVLSSCESGQSQQSNSDEPFSFPTLLHQAGVGGVIAPLWRVDDLATFLLITRMQDDLADGIVPARALGRASHWLRTLSARDTLRRLDDLQERIREAGADGSFDDAVAALNLQREWLQAAFMGPEQPFDAPLFWAGFQHLGAPAGS